MQKSRNALRILVANEKIPRFASLTVAEMLPELRGHVLPISGAREYNWIFDKGLAALYREAIDRGYVAVIDAEDVVRLLLEGHFTMATRIVKTLPVRGNIIKIFMSELAGADRRITWPAIAWMETNFRLEREVVRALLFEETDAREYTAAEKRYRTPGYDPKVADWILQLFWSPDVESDE